MQYFVSIENTNYFYWQIELLIESFKMKGIEDKLLIGIAQNDQPKNPKYTKNLMAHPRKFIHRNVGAEANYLPQNKPFAVMAALENGLRFPFTLLHPDMILVNEPEVPKANLVFHPDFSLNPLIEDVRSYLAESIDIDPKSLPKNLLLGGVMIFNDMNENFFFRTYRWMQWLRSKFGPTRKWDIAKVAWMLSAYEVVALKTCVGMPLECQLIQKHKPTHFIHYSRGLPPIFSKKYYAQKNLQIHGNPYELLRQHNPSEAMNFLHKVIDSRS